MEALTEHKFIFGTVFQNILTPAVFCAKLQKNGTMFPKSGFPLHFFGSTHCWPVFGIDRAPQRYPKPQLSGVVEPTFDDVTSVATLANETTLVGTDPQLLKNEENAIEKAQ